MTREQAIEFGKMWLQINEDAKDSDTYNFFKFSIEALEQEIFINKPCCISGEVCEHDKNVVLDKLRAEIEEAALDDANGSKFIFVNRVNQIIDKYRTESENKE